MQSTGNLEQTGSVVRAFSALLSVSEPSSWEICRELLTLHGEYGTHLGARIAETAGPREPRRKPLSEWQRELDGLFDPQMVSELHGRLVILGLCWLDAQLKRYLDGYQLVRLLRDELYEDFESLLKAEHAGKEAYRGTILRLLHNKAKFDSSMGLPRKTGFVVVASGGPGLRGVAELLHHQVRKGPRYNLVFSAHYIVKPGGTLGDGFRDFLADLDGLLKHGSATAGSLLPDLTTDLTRWQKVVAQPLEDLISTTQRESEPAPFEELLRQFNGKLAGDDVLGTGKRLVALFEFRRVPRNASLDSLGFTVEVLGLLRALPERVGLVVSGLPKAVSVQLTTQLTTPVTGMDSNAVTGEAASSEQSGATGAVGPTCIHIELPPDPDLIRGEALTNDLPGGPDRTGILDEINALAESIALKDLVPPVVVGVIGGWGAGKSFVLHLIEKRLREVRCEQVIPGTDGDDPDFPYVGHPYVIRFDAWTYAKGNLWASLMQQIFIELDRQLGLEHDLMQRLKIPLTEGTKIWRLLSRVSEAERQLLLNETDGKIAVKVAAEFEAGRLGESRLWQVLEDLREDEKTQLQEEEATLEIQSIALQGMRRAATHIASRDIQCQTQSHAASVAMDSVFRGALERCYEGLRRAGTPLGTVPSFDNIVDLKSQAQWLWQQPWWMLGSFVVFAAGLPVLERLLELGIENVSVLAPALGVVFSCLTGAGQLARTLNRKRQQFEESVQATQPAHTADDLLNMAIQYVQATERSGAKTVGLPDGVSSALLQRAQAIVPYMRQLEDRRAGIEIRRARVGMTARHPSILEFVRNRIEGQFYEDKLGLMHQVKSDLQNLSDALLDPVLRQEQFPRGKPRIVVLIDDLDRCPPEKVVEVLEATQLLVKTPLFVVVIAMDVRYVTRALEKEYEGVLLASGEPSGLDYIEKIIQIPYRVRPVSRDAITRFLWSQMAPEEPIQEPPIEEEAEASERHQNRVPLPIKGADEADSTELSEGEGQRAPLPQTYGSELPPLPTEVLRFSSADHQLIAECCAAFEVSPRTMKRLVNVFRLLKILWLREGFEAHQVNGGGAAANGAADPAGNGGQMPQPGPENDVKRAMLALLVIAASYPEPMRRLLHAVERHYTELVPQGIGVADPSGPAQPEQFIVDYLLARCAEYAATARIPQEWEEVAAAFRDEALFPPGLTFSTLGERHFHLVSSFSFVGESDLERSARLVREEEDAPHNGGARSALTAPIRNRQGLRTPRLGYRRTRRAKSPPSEHAPQN